MNMHLKIFLIRFFIHCMSDINFSTIVFIKHRAASLLAEPTLIIQSCFISYLVMREFAIYSAYNVNSNANTVLL